MGCRGRNEVTFDFTVPNPVHPAGDAAFASEFDRRWRAGMLLVSAIPLPSFTAFGDGIVCWTTRKEINKAIKHWQGLRPDQRVQGLISVSEHIGRQIAAGMPKDTQGHRDFMDDLCVLLVTRLTMADDITDHAIERAKLARIGLALHEDESLHWSKRGKLSPQMERRLKLPTHVLDRRPTKH
jgi:hypothetical protein